MTAATPRASCKLGGAHMNAAAAKRMRLTRVLARLWLVHMRLGLRACWSGLLKRCGCDGRHTMTTGAASAAPLQCAFSKLGN